MSTNIYSCMTKPTKWYVRPAKTRISLGICPVWSEFLLSAWRKRVLATHWVHSKDWSYAQADLSLSWAYMQFCRFCHALAHLSFSTPDIWASAFLWWLNSMHAHLAIRKLWVWLSPVVVNILSGDWSWNNFDSHYLSSTDLRREIVGFWWKIVHKY